MTKEQEEQAVRLFRELDISEVMAILMQHGNRYNKRVLKFFRWFCKFVPFAIMTFHAFGIYEFSKHPREMFILIKENMLCYCFIYFMLYVFPMVIVVASRFFWLCWRYRIPFFYMFGVNAIHIAYRSLFTTNDMIMAHYCLMIMIVAFYFYGFIDWTINNTVFGKKFFS